eukprot:1184668-Prorocentrum_minimum.AAC.4
MKYELLIYVMHAYTGVLSAALPLLAQEDQVVGLVHVGQVVGMAAVHLECAQRDIQELVVRGNQHPPAALVNRHPPRLLERSHRRVQRQAARLPHPRRAPFYRHCFPGHTTVVYTQVQKSAYKDTPPSTLAALSPL